MTTLPTAMYDPSLGDASTSPRRLQFAYTSVGGQTRLSTVTDALGRVYNYNYDGSGQLISVQKPAVADPSQGGAMARPTVQFTYETTPFEPRLISKSNGGKPWDSKELISWTLPSSITDARGTATSFQYVFRNTPTALQSYNGQPVGLWEHKPRLASVTTPDGTATFDELARDFTSAATAVTDTRGVTTTYQFGSDTTNQIVPAPNDLGFAIVMDRFTRSVNVTDADGNTSTKTATYNYGTDINGNLTSVTDTSGNTVAFYYDSGDASDPYNQQPFGSFFGTHYALTGQPALRVQDPGQGHLNLATKYRYDTTFNKQTEEIDPAGKVTTYTLDAQGNRTQATDGAGTALASTTNYTYDSRGFTTSMTDPDGRVTDYVPNALGNLQYTIVKGVAGEDLTPLTSSSPFPDQNPDGKWIVTARTADVMDRTLSSTDADGNTTTYAYDNLDRLLSTTLPAVTDPISGATVAAAVMASEYDFNGNVVKQTDANGNVTTSTYDAMNRKTQSRRRMSDPNADSGADLVSSTTYDAAGEPISQTDPLGHVTQHVYDAMLRPIETIEPAVTVNSDPTSTSATPATTTQQYTTKMYYGANSGSGAFTHQGFNPTRVIDARGNATDTVYDAAYRAVRTVQRTNSGAGVATTDAARAGEPETDVVYNADGKVVRTTVKNETADGTSADRNTYTFYDELQRPTISVVDMTGSGLAANPITTSVDDASAFTAPGGDLTTRTAYDVAGQAIAATDANGNTTHMIYDGAGRVTQKVAPEVTVFLPGVGTQTVAPTTSTVYDAASNPVLVTDANGNQSQTQYDPRNRPVRTILDHNGDGVFDSTQSPTAADVVTVTGYDQVGNKVHMVDPNGNRTDITYDRDNRPILTQGPAVADAENGGAMARPQTSTQYDADSNVTSVTDPRGIVTQTQYDQLNRPRFVIQNADAANGAADRQVTETRYDANGKKLAVVLYNTTPQVTTTQYDALNRPISQTLPQASISDTHVRTTTTTYDRTGEALNVTDPMGQQTQSVYDRAGRVTEQTFLKFDGSTDEARASTYDNNGNLLSRSDKNGSSAWTYDALNRQLTEGRDTTTAGIADSSTVVSAYDPDGNRTKVVYPDTGRTLTSTYDHANRMTQVDDQSGAVARTTTFAYDATGNRTSETLPNSVVQTTTFDAGNRVLNLHSAGVVAAPIYDITYAYDLAGQRRSAVENLTGQDERDTTWTYDGLYRLTGENWTGPDAQDRAYTYDHAGNRLSEGSSVTGHSASLTSFTYDNLNELLNSHGSDGEAFYTYDFNGNRITKTTDGDIVTNYVFDTSDRLIEADQAGAVIFTAAYDAATNRLAKTEGSSTASPPAGSTGSPQATLFRYDAGTNFQELNGSDVVTKELIRAGGLGGGIGSVLYSDESIAPTPGPAENFTYDAVGNTVALTDATGAPTQTTLYGAFGDTLIQTGSSDNNRLHNTKERDASIGLDDYGMRYYDASTGSFITRDPIGYSDGMNVYQSVHDDPVNAFDPNGLVAPAAFRSTHAQAVQQQQFLNFLDHQVGPRVLGAGKAVVGAAALATTGIAALGDPEPVTKVLAVLGSVKAAEITSSGIHDMIHGESDPQAPAIAGTASQVAKSMGAGPEGQQAVGNWADAPFSAGLIASQTPGVPGDPTTPAKVETQLVQNAAADAAVGKVPTGKGTAPDAGSVSQRGGPAAEVGGSPATRADLDADLTSKGFENKGTSPGGYTTYTNPDGRVVTIKPTGEVIPTKPAVSTAGKAYNERTDYNFNRLPDQSHSTGHFVEPNSEDEE